MAPTGVLVSLGILGVFVLVLGGLLGLKLLAMFINVVVAGQRPHHMAPRGTTSTGFSSFLVGGALVALLIGAALMVTVRSRSVTIVDTQGFEESARQELARQMEAGAVELQEAAARLSSSATQLERVDVGESVASAVDTVAEQIEVLSDARAAMQSAASVSVTSIPVDEAASGSERPADTSSSTVSVNTGDEPAATATVSSNGEQPAATTGDAAAPPAESAGNAGADPAGSDASRAVTVQSVPQVSGDAASPEDESTESASPTLPVDPARQQQMLQWAALLGQLVNSRLAQQQNQQMSAGPDGVLGTDDDAVVFQLSSEMVDEILGASGQEVLKSFNDQLPESVRQSYALIPLTPSAASPAQPKEPLIPDGSIDSLKSSLISLVRIADPSGKLGNASDSPVVLATAPELRPMPDWVKNPGGRWLVAETDSVFSGDDEQRLLTEAINKSLNTHLEKLAQTLSPALRNETQNLVLTMDPASALKCVVEKWERYESVESEVEGSKSFRKIYALVEFPEQVDADAVAALKEATQLSRVTGLGAVVAFGWLGVAGLGWGVRLWRRGGGFRKLVAVPVFGVLAVPAIIGAGALIVGLAQGMTPEAPWLEYSETIAIEL